MIVVHGGAGRIGDALHAAALAGVERAVRVGRDLLLAGASAQQACVAAVRVLEDEPSFNAGRGSCMNAEGNFEVDAGIMRSRDGAMGAIAAVPDLADAIVVAELVMERSRHNMLAGPAAARFAREHGVGRFGAEHLWTSKAQDKYEQGRAGGAEIDGQADTVGAVALDARGDLCVGCSTGGVLLKTPGRVGDSPLCGPGFFAHPTWGAATATGMGEAIMAHVASYEALRRIAQGDDPRFAVQSVCDEVGRSGATCGIISITADGRIALGHHSPHMSWASARGAQEPEVGLSLR